MHFMRPRLLIAASMLCVASACATGPGPDLEPIASPGPLAQPVPAAPADVATAGAAVLERFGLPVAALEREEGRVMSGELVVHEEWLGSPVEARILCGSAYTRVGPPANPRHELKEARRLTRSMPISVRVGFEAEPGLDESSTRLVVEATGRPAEVTPLGAREVGCVPTRHFVDELFDALTVALAG